MNTYTFYQIGTKIANFLAILITFLIRLVLIVITPSYYACWTAYVLPDLASFFKLGFIAIALLFILQTFLFINCLGNKILNAGNDVEKDNIQDSNDCDPCRCTDNCHSDSNYCIIKRTRRDRIITEYVNNKRYHILHVIYMVLICFNGTIWTGIFLLSKYGLVGFVRETLGFFIQIDDDSSTPWIYEHKKNFNPNFAVFFFGLFIVLSVGPLAFYHAKNVLSIKNRRKHVNVTENCKTNLEMVFGKKWKGAIFWPFTGILDTNSN